MPKPLDLAGQRFGRLVAVERLFEREGYLSSTWVCRCDCGKEARIFIGNLRNGNTKSCGCMAKDALAARSTTHGMTNSLEYSSWQAIKNRCYNEKHEQYIDYGGRGIVMCDEWKESFEAFYRDMGPRPSDKHSIDREDNNLGYSKDNCRWATASEQANNRRSNRLYEYNGQVKTLTQWCRELDLSYAKIKHRLSRSGWTFSRAVREK